MQDCLVIMKWSWHSLRQNVIPHKFCIEWAIFTVNIKLYLLLWQQHILEHKTTYFLHALLMDEGSALCQNISINPDSMFLYFATLLSSGWALPLWIEVSCISRRHENAKFFSKLFCEEHFKWHYLVYNVQIFLKWQWLMLYTGCPYSSHSDHMFDNYLFYRMKTANTYITWRQERIYNFCFLDRKSIEVNIQLNHMGKLWY